MLSKRGTVVKARKRTLFVLQYIQGLQARSQGAVPPHFQNVTPKIFRLIKHLA